MAGHFTLSARFGVMRDGDTVSVETSVTIPHPLGDEQLKNAFVEIARNAYPRLWDAVKPKENS